MLIISGCVLLLVGGLVAAVRWGGLAVARSAVTASAEPTVEEVLRRFLWWLTVATVSGLGAGLLVTGAGGRLAMRLLAATSPEAQGRLTEADEVVGEISLDGTVGLIVFAGLLPGFASAVVYLVIRRWLPTGRLGGLSFGLLLLLSLSTRVDPLRSDNVDFDIVGPGWLAFAAFAPLVVLHGMTVAALAARYSGVLPLPSKDRRVLSRYAPLLLLVVLLPLALLALGAGLLVALMSRLPRPSLDWEARAVLVAGRAALVLLALAALPGFVGAAADILGSS